MEEDEGSELGAMFWSPEAKRRFLRDIVVSFVLAGKDTTSSALTWFFWLLAANPRCERRVYEEAASLSLHGHGDGDNHGVDDDDGGGYDELRGMHYLHAAITEAMRLYPPVPILKCNTLRKSARGAYSSRLVGGGRWGSRTDGTLLCAPAWFFSVPMRGWRARERCRTAACRWFSTTAGDAMGEMPRLWAAVPPRAVARRRRRVCGGGRGKVPGFPRRPAGVPREGDVVRADEGRCGRRGQEVLRRAGAGGEHGGASAVRDGGDAEDERRAACADKEAGERLGPALIMTGSPINRGTLAASTSVGPSVSGLRGPE
ncbi:unnamed protein product [Miscanthus lutarioriparius]|uniref:Cytochrome P450 n=1 Tax=Miscanthus lutarioriparius TaxID=422564 RepID=A0A811NND8_9POAL|nr:unnamed protein product [Miscanthus lutarioriparius]